MTALLLTVLVTGLVLGAYLLTVQAAGSWRDASLLQVQTHLLLERLVADLGAARHVLPPAPHAPDTLWEITLASGDRHTYRLARSTLYRDGHLLHTAPVSVAALVLTPFRDDRNVDALPPRRRIRIRLTTRAGPHRLRLETAVALRHPPSWPPCCRSANRPPPFTDPDTSSAPGSASGRARWSPLPGASP